MRRLSVLLRLQLLLAEQQISPPRFILPVLLGLAVRPGVGVKFVGSWQGGVHAIACNAVIVIVSVSWRGDRGAARSGARM